MHQREKKSTLSAKKDEFYTPRREKKNVIESTERWKVWSTEDKSVARVEHPSANVKKWEQRCDFCIGEDKIGKQKKNLNKWKRARAPNKWDKIRVRLQSRSETTGKKTKQQLEAAYVREKCKQRIKRSFSGVRKLRRVKALRKRSNNGRKREVYS